jgi:glycosyltransferase involved in cell wall biosynthesis
MASAQAYPLLGGVESHIDEVSAGLVSAGCQVTSMSTDRSGALPRTSRRNGVLLRRFRAWPRHRDYFASPGLFFGVLRADCDLVHVQGVHTLAPPAAMLAAILRRRPFVVTIHTGGHSSPVRNRMRGLQFALLAPLLRRAAAIIGVSEYEAELFADVLGVPVDDIRVIRNGGVTPPAHQVAVIDDLIVSVGRLERYKGHHRAIEALPYLARARPDVRLRILGAGPYRQQLLDLAQQLDVADRVTIDFVPPEQREAMAIALSEAAVVSLLSDYESHPVAVMEALGVGRPVVALDTSGVSELVRMGLVNGLPADVEAEAVAEALLAELLSPRPPYRGALPSWQDCVRQVAEVYESALAPSRGVAPVTLSQRNAGM